MKSIEVKNYDALYDIHKQLAHIIYDLRIMCPNIMTEDLILDCMRVVKRVDQRLYSVPGKYSSNMIISTEVKSLTLVMFVIELSESGVNVGKLMDFLMSSGLLNINQKLMKNFSTYSKWLRQFDIDILIRKHSDDDYLTLLIINPNGELINLGNRWPKNALMD